MRQELLKYLEMYHPQIAPFMHLQINEWGKNRPLEGVKILHHVPLVPNTLLKIAALVAANAEVTVTNPASFVRHILMRLLVFINQEFLMLKILIF